MPGCTQTRMWLTRANQLKGSKEEGLQIISCIDFLVRKRTLMINWLKMKDKAFKKNGKWSLMMLLTFLNQSSFFLLLQ